MYLHIGKDRILKKENILFILDYENLKDNKQFKNFFSKIPEKNKIDISNQNPKTILIIQEKGIIKAYISNISSTTLGKREEYKYFKR